MDSYAVMYGPNAPMSYHGGMPMGAMAGPVGYMELQPNCRPSQRLGRDAWLILEAHFSRENRPSSATKKMIAAHLRVPIDKINNWFQNRRAKLKQEAKRALMERQNLPQGLGQNEAHDGTPVQSQGQVQSQAQAPVQASNQASSIQVQTPSQGQAQLQVNHPVSSTPSLAGSEDTLSTTVPSSESSTPDDYLSAAPSRLPVMAHTPADLEKAALTHVRASVTPSEELNISSVMSSYCQPPTAFNAGGNLPDMYSNPFLGIMPSLPENTDSIEESTPAAPNSEGLSPAESEQLAGQDLPEDFGNMSFESFSLDLWQSYNPGLYSPETQNSPAVSTYSAAQALYSPAVASFADDHTQSMVQTQLDMFPTTTFSIPEPGYLSDALPTAPLPTTQPLLDTSFSNASAALDMSNSATVSLSPESYSMPAPDSSRFLKAEQSSQPSLAIRRRKAPPALGLGPPGSMPRATSFTAGLPNSPRSPLMPGDHTLRKVKSTINGSGRIQKPATPRNAQFSPGPLTNHYRFPENTQTPPPSAPSTELNMPSIRYPQHGQQFAQLAVQSTQSYLPVPYSAPPTQLTFPRIEIMGSVGHEQHVPSMPSSSAA